MKSRTVFFIQTSLVLLLVIGGAISSDWNWLNGFGVGAVGMSAFINGLDWFMERD